jgi:hypothetical protein|nr:MAG TPA: hypothetical protein [Caudoviricetes sp.]
MDRTVTGKVEVWEGSSFPRKLLARGANRVVTGGLVLLAQRIFEGNAVKLPLEFRLGDSAAITTDSMTGLQGSTVATIPCTVSRRGNVLSWMGTFTYTGQVTKDCLEIGLFQSQADGNTMLARFLPLQQFTIKNGVPIRVTWEIKVGE